MPQWLRVLILEIVVLAENPKSVLSTNLAAYNYLIAPGQVNLTSFFLVDLRGFSILWVYIHTSGTSTYT